MKLSILKKFAGVVILFLLVLDYSSALAKTGRVLLVKIVGQEFQPNKLSAWPGDILKICNEYFYRRQPYSHSAQNKFGKRSEDAGLLLKQGECMEVEIKNDSPKWLKMKVRDAVAGKAKLEIEVNPGVKK